MRFNMRHAFRMAKWARNPPGEKRVKLVFAVLAICLLLFGFERMFGWPEWLTMDEAPGGRLKR
ncbi:hypothetical protein [Maritimibacter dapengensis]|uniref:Uncharacterized protein n=1 Tax=Maritimibacter dapengensis TaxID=2836868 RepID=A0ABS6T300_9RHOB|nr:hypothetical protein [Maritimibacter dapengensis]MBV7379514.1 hypothetical protein [Maritimibacter dapengensis]